jgi:hypothetical protein
MAEATRSDASRVDDALDAERRAGIEQFSRSAVERAYRAPSRSEKAERLERGTPARVRPGANRGESGEAIRP